MVTLGIDCMRYFDEKVLDHLAETSQNGRVHIIYDQLAKDLRVHRNTAFNTVKKLRNAGHLQLISGSDRTGYTYRIKRD